jgi:SulP family sulfate permease
VTVAVLCSLDTLLTTSVVDGRLRRSRDANRELVAQGLANVAAALVGGQPASPSVPRSLSLVLPQVERRHAVVGYAALTLALLLFAPRLLALLPASAVGGLLLAQGLQMLSSSLWRTPADVWMIGRRRVSHPGYDQTQRRMLLTNWAVMVAVALSALLFGLGVAVLIGATCAVLLFVRANMRDVVRRSWTAETRQSLKSRPLRTAAALRREGHRTVLLELEGSLFFGTADALRVRLHALPDTVETLILDLHQIKEIDVTAARILFELAEDRHSAGKRVVFAEWASDDRRRRVVEAVAGGAGRRHLHFAGSTDEALEQSEELLLERLPLERDVSDALPLAATNIARGMAPDELARLAAELESVRFASGQVLFRQGDPGDALYISLKGDIGLRLPGTTRRLASFAPGVTVGEMAMLARSTRSAEAVAESDVEALRLSVDAFDRLQRAHPQLATRLLTNIALHLGDRVRILTGDLSQWVVRAAVGHTADALAAAPDGDADPESTFT